MRIKMSKTWNGGDAHGRDKIADRMIYLTKKKGMITMKKIVSYVLVFAILSMLSMPAFAASADKIQGETAIFKTSETGYMEIITFDRKLKDSNLGQEYEINYYNNGELVQSVQGQYQGEILKVFNYSGGNVEEQTIDLQSRVVERKNVSVPIETMSDDYGTAIGSINYNRVGDRPIVIVRIFSKLTYSDNESYTIRANATDTLGVVVGIILSFGLSFLGNLGVVQNLAVAIVGGLGGNVAGDAIGIFLSEDVAVDAYYYTLTGCDVGTGRYVPEVTGIARQVTTKASKNYDQWFYEGHTPYNWKDEVLAMHCWMYLYPGNYPGVMLYREY